MPLINWREIMAKRKNTQAVEPTVEVEVMAPAVEPTVEVEVEVEVEAPTLDQAISSMIQVKTKKNVKTVKTGVGAQILYLIAQGHLSNKEILVKVREDNPLRQTTYACVAWYQSQVKAGKIDLPEVQEQDL
jgi:hypothetical protein